jgi:hypothetical protein
MNMDKKELDILRNKAHELSSQSYKIMGKKHYAIFGDSFKYGNQNFWSLIRATYLMRKSLSLSLIAAKNGDLYSTFAVAQTYLGYPWTVRNFKAARHWIDKTKSHSDLDEHLKERAKEEDKKLTQEVIHTERNTKRGIIMGGILMISALAMIVSTLVPAFALLDTTDHRLWLGAALLGIPGYYILRKHYGNLNLAMKMYRYEPEAAPIGQQPSGHTAYEGTI